MRSGGGGRLLLGVGWHLWLIWPGKDVATVFRGCGTRGRGRGKGRGEGEELRESEGTGSRNGGLLERAASV